MDQPFAHLLVPTDGSQRSIRALEKAVALARALGARITVLHVRSSGPMPVSGMGDTLDPATVERLLATRRSEAARILAEGEAICARAGVPADGQILDDDLPHRAILAAASRCGCDLIVMASHGRRGLGGLLLGSETQRVLVQAPCPVLVCR
ncbi:MAG: universal stress protein [Synechococcaceae cyanobacterium]|nr:universal stress protein [Synechococcaceae cyanobacterium]